VVTIWRFKKKALTLQRIFLRMMKRLIKPIALWLLTLTVLAIIMLSFEADLLWKVQQHNVFLNTSLFFHQMMAMPGGMLSYL
jgi:hypothetical protein